MAAPRVGDIVEIKTSRGLAYAQISHVHDMYGYLFRVFSGFFADRPDRFSRIVQGDERFVAFVGLKVGLRDGSMQIVANEPVPSKSRTFPTFRAGTLNLAAKKMEFLSLWDGSKTWKIGAMTREQKLLPARSLWGPELLVERLESGWLPGSSEV
jgi:hypothetical protein